MEQRTKRKLKAAGKVAFGVGRGVSAVLLGTGHGFMGAAMKRHHMMLQAARLASKSLQSAGETINEGLKDWDKA